MSRTSRIVVVAVFVSVLVSAAVVGAWTGDFFDSDASGNATYEAMVIAPAAVYDPISDQTVMAYQGSELDPYVCVYDHTAEEWSEPVYIGENPLAPRLDTHGGPSITLDAAGYYHIFWGAHNTRLWHAISVAPHDASSWRNSSIFIGGRTVVCTYPQPILGEDGTLHLWIRGGDSDPVPTPETPSRGDIASIDTTNGTTWTRGQTLVEASATALWYGGVYQGDSGRLHLALIKAPRAGATSNADPFMRRNLYYLYSDDGLTWTESTGTPIPVPATLETLEASCTVLDSGAQMVNQVVVRELQDGSPCLLYLQGDTSDPLAVYEWRFMRHDPVLGWLAPVTIAETDNFMDACDMDVGDDGTVSAYVITEGTLDSQARIDDTSPLYAARGGDLARYTSFDGGTTWSKDPTWIKRSDTPNARYNDPQIVANARDEAQLLFSEWNNDASAYFHKVFLWGSNGLIHKEITPEITRLEGPDRVATGARTAQIAYPVVSSTAILARKDDYPDVLCGVPLAQAYRAPILLVSSGSLDASASAELTRLRPSRVIVLGGTASISTTVTAQVTSVLAPVLGKNPTVERISGPDRYETSRLIAERLRTLKGSPTEAVVVSGEGFADALSTSPYAARIGAPVILTRSTSLGTSTLAALSESGVNWITMAGGPAAISEEVELELETAGYYVDRLAGSDRYETGRLVVEHGIDADVFGMQRFVLASGEGFADATTGGYLAARVAGPLLLTRAGYLSPPTAEIIDERATRVIDAYAMGGTVALSDDVVNELQIRLIGDTP